MESNNFKKGLWLRYKN